MVTLVLGDTGIFWAKHKNWRRAFQAEGKQVQVIKDRYL